MVIKGAAPKPKKHGYNLPFCSVAIAKSDLAEHTDVSVCLDHSYQCHTHVTREFIQHCSICLYCVHLVNEFHSICSKGVAKLSVHCAVSI